MTNPRLPIAATVVAGFSALLVVVGLLPAMAAPRAQVAALTEITTAGGFQPLLPSRILDTRSANGVATTTPVPSQQSVELQVTGRGGVPESGVGAVVLNVTVTAPTWNGFITVYPTGSVRPTASNLNFAQGQTIPNLVTVKVGTDGKVTLFNGQIPGHSVHMVADVAGYYLAGTPTEPGTFVSLSPSRILDTRSANGVATTTPVPSQQSVELQVTGRGGVPESGVGAVVLNVTVTAPTWNGFITVYPTGSVRPTASNLNFAQGQTIPNLVTVKVGTDGKVTLFNGQIPGHSVHMVADVAGYYLAGTPTEPGTFVSLSPSRILDTRSANGVATTTPVPSQEPVELQVTGRGGVPESGVGAVVLNVTVTAPTWNGYVTVYPTGWPRPNASNLNFAQGQTIPNLVAVKLGANGTVSLFDGQIPGHSVHLVADVSGYFLDVPEDMSVTDLAVDSVTTSSVTLRWTNPQADGFTGVMVRRAQGPVPPATPTAGDLVGETTGPVTLWSDTGLTAGNTYSYALFAQTGVGSEPPATITVTVPTEPALTGAVTGAGGPVSGVTVHVTGVGGLEAAHAATAADGTYSVAGLAPGTYTVCFNPAGGSLGPDGLGYLPECWNNVQPDGAPTTITVDVGSTVTDIDANLATAGSISGTVTAADSEPIAGVAVSVDEPGGDPVLYAITDDLGHWSVPGLAPGAYGVCFDPSDITSTTYVPECYDGKNPSTDPTLITVVGGTGVTGVDASLQPAAAGVGPVASGMFTTPSTQLANVACADTLFLGARGSGQNGPGGTKNNPVDPNDGLGQEVHTAYEAFADAITDSRTMTPAVSVSYPADGVSKILSGSYVGHMWQGVLEVRLALAVRAIQCPGERIVLAGYSQGAMVMHRVLSNATTSGVGGLAASVRNRIDAAILIADGDRVASDTTRNFGSANDAAHGIGTQLDSTIRPAPKLPLTIGAKTFSVCNSGDIVCDFRFGSLTGTSTHLNYKNGRVVEDAAAAAAIWAQAASPVGSGPAFIVSRDRGPAGFEGYAAYVRCPAGVTEVSLSPAPGLDFSTTSAFPFVSPHFITSRHAAPGMYPMELTCLDDGVETKTYWFALTITGPAHNISVAGTPGPGQTLIVSDGGGCGPFFNPIPQQAHVMVFDMIEGGSAIVNGFAAVDPLGRWGPVSVTIPAGYSTTAWRVIVRCGSLGDIKYVAGYNYNEVNYP